jgi:hypothetical protein
VIVRKVNPREIMVFISERGEGRHLVRLRHKPTGIEGQGEAGSVLEARGLADADLDAHLKAAGLER